MNNKSRSYILCVIFFGICIMFISCKRESEYDISLTSESMLEGGSEVVSGKKSENDLEPNSQADSGWILNENLESDNKGNGTVTVEKTEHTVFVYVTGQVQNPGVYQVSENARIYQAIELAGGFTSKASRVSMNLAEKVVDGQHINVMSKKQYKALQSSDDSAGIQDLKSNKDNSQTLDVKENSSDLAVNDKININEATEDELMQLPGIGESKAKAIIAYREENGPFKSSEDIMQVSGIKEGAYEKIKALIKI